MGKKYFDTSKEKKVSSWKFSLRGYNFMNNVQPDALFKTHFLLKTFFFFLSQTFKNAFISYVLQ